MIKKKGVFELEMNMYLYRFTLIFSGLGKNIADVSNIMILDRLKIADFIINCIHYIWCAIYLAIGTLGDYIATCFNEISRIDFTTIIDVGGFEVTLNALTWGLLTMSLIVAFILSLFKTKLDLEYVKWTVVTVFAIACLGEYNTWIRGYLSVGLEIVDETFEYDELSLSEQIFYDNSYDMLKSLGTGELTLVDRKIPMNRININETMSKNDLQGIVRFDIGGNVLYDDLSDGFMNSGLFEERYYRYSFDFGTMILTMLVCVIVYLIGMFKIAYVGFNWFYTDLYGGVIMAIGVSSANKIKFVYLSILKCLPSFLLTYVGVSIFRMMITSILAMEVEPLTKVVLLFVGGFVSILGSDAVSKGFGIDDGAMFMLKSLMLSRQMSRLGKGIGGMAHKGMNGVKGGLSSMSKGKQGGYDESPYNNVQDATYESHSSNFDPSHTLTNNNEPLKLDNNVEESSKPIYGGDGMSPQDEKNGGLLENKIEKDNRLFGGDGIKPHYHNHDTTDTNNERIKEKVDDKKARYAEGEKIEKAIPKHKVPLSNLPEQKEEVSENHNDENVERETVQESGRIIIPQEKIDMSNIEMDRFGTPVPKGYTCKTYDDYKKDYDKGINNPYKKAPVSTYKSENAFKEKQLPKWFHEQSNPNEDDEVERHKAMAQLKILRAKTEDEEKQAQAELNALSNENE